jgi:hypothetical protein
MNKSDFLFLLLGASYASFKFAKEFVKNDLKPEFKYDLELNISHDNPELKQFDIYPDDNEKKYFDLTDKEVIEILCRKNKVPVWIDIAVCKSDRKKTTFKLLCAGRYSDDKNEFYYTDNGSGPFGIKSPNHPIGYKTGTKFRLKKK